MRPLRRRWCARLALVPVALVLLVAAPLVFEFRDLDGAGLVVVVGRVDPAVGAGLALVVAALREAIPGRTWSRAALVTTGRRAALRS